MLMVGLLAINFVSTNSRLHLFFLQWPSHLERELYDWIQTHNRTVMNGAQKGTAKVSEQF